MNKERLMNHLNNITEEQTIDMIKQTTKDLSKYYKAKVKSLRTEVDEWLTSRARSTTTRANAHNNSRMYSATKELLQELIIQFNKKY